MNSLSYAEVIERIESRGIMPERAPSLEPMRIALSSLQLPQAMSERRLDLSRVIVVAGTNGKGTVAATLEALLRDAGLRTGLYTSPHLIDTCERIQFNGTAISQELFVQAYQRLTQVIEQSDLSHFEILTTMAAWLFFANQLTEAVDVAIFEVGLGGLWDATNAIPHSTNVITRLGFDHQNLLGSTLTEIARNKFGIIGHKHLVVHTTFAPELTSLVEETRGNTHSKWVEAPEFTSWFQPGLSGLPRFFIQTQWGEAELSAVGRRGAENTNTALACFAELGFDPRNHMAALANVQWPGRMEKLELESEDPPVFVSGDHNPQGIESLLELLSAYPRNRLLAVVGIGRDKQAGEMLERLTATNLIDQLILTESPFRGRRMEEYGPWLEKAAAAVADPIKAIRHARKMARAGDMILVTGSLYLVGEVKRKIASLNRD